MHYVKFDHIEQAKLPPKRRHAANAVEDLQVRLFLYQRLTAALAFAAGLLFIVVLVLKASL